MKQRIYYLGLATLFIIFLGTLSKISHWPGGRNLLILGIVMLLFAFLPLALLNNYHARGTPENRILYKVTWLTCFVIFTAMLFKIQHWPGAGKALIISLPFPYVVFLPVFLAVTGRDINYNINNIVSVLFLLVIVSGFSALLALGLSKEKIADSLTLARNCRNVNNSMVVLNSADPETAVDNKIDELLKLIGEYRNLNLGYYKTEEEHWAADPEIIMTSGSWQKITNRMMKDSGKLIINLKTGLIDLIFLLEKTPGCEIIARSAPGIFSIEKISTGSYDWKADVEIGPLQLWTLIYLEGLEANLRMIRITSIVCK